MTEPLPGPDERLPFDLWWSPSMKRLLSRHENQDDEHLVWIHRGEHESLRHYLGTGLDSNPPMPDDAVRLVLADPEQKVRVVKAQQACANAVEHATTPEATQLPTRVLALLADPGAVHEVEVDDQGEQGDCIDDCIGCAADRGEHIADPGLQAELEQAHESLRELNDHAVKQLGKIGQLEAEVVKQRIIAKNATDHWRQSSILARLHAANLSGRLELRKLNDAMTRKNRVIAKRAAERDLALWLHAEAMWRNEGLDTITAQAVRLMAKAYAERDAQTKLAAGLAEERNTAWRRAYGLQARIDAALELVTDHHSMEVQRVGIEAIRAALQGDQTTEETDHA